MRSGRTQDLAPWSPGSSLRQTPNSAAGGPPPAAGVCTAQSSGRAAGLEQPPARSPEDPGPPGKGTGSCSRLGYIRGTGLHPEGNCGERPGGRKWLRSREDQPTPRAGVRAERGGHTPLRSDVSCSGRYDEKTGSGDGGARSRWGASPSRADGVLPSLLFLGLRHLPSGPATPAPLTIPLESLPQLGGQSSGLPGVSPALPLARLEAPDRTGVGTPRTQLP